MENLIIPLEKQINSERAVGADVSEATSNRKSQRTTILREKKRRRCEEETCDEEQPELLVVNTRRCKRLKRAPNTYTKVDVKISVQRNNKKKLDTIKKPRGQYVDGKQRSRTISASSKRSRSKITSRKVSRTKIKKAKIKSFDERFDALLAFKAKHGHCTVSTSRLERNKEYLSLGIWCDHIRRTYRLIQSNEISTQKIMIRLTQSNIQRLNEIGFDWYPGDKVGFEVRFKELLAFKAKYGHCNVKTSLAESNLEYRSLGTWCSRMRRIRRKIQRGMKVQRNLTPENIERLTNEGFLWDR